MSCDGDCSFCMLRGNCSELDKSRARAEKAFREENRNRLDARRAQRMAKAPDKDKRVVYLLASDVTVLDGGIVRGKVNGVAVNLAEATQVRSKMRALGVVVSIVEWRTAETPEDARAKMAKHGDSFVKISSARIIAQ